MGINMWILSQDSLTIVKCECISVRQYGSKAYQIIGDERFVLGEYSTKCEALEVLDDIRFRIKFYEDGDTYFYEMP